MRVLVDADACPVKQIIVEIAKRKHIPVIMLIDTSHELHDEYSQIITVDHHTDSVDFALMGILTKEDIVITQDYGLAAMVLGKGAQVLNQNGYQYTNDNIETLLMSRHIGKQIRRHGGRTKGSPKRIKDDDKNFARKFEQILSDSLES